MGRVIDAVERLLFGATAQERVDMLTELAARRAEHRLALALAEDEPVDDDATPEIAPASGEE